MSEIETLRPYRPSNGVEGEIFMETFCSRCERDRAYRDGTGDSCPIIAATMAFDIDDPGYPKEWVLNDDDNPTCTAFVALPAEPLA